MLEDRDWFRLAGASSERIQALRVAAPSGLPESYLALLSFSDGGEGPLPVQPYNLVLDPAQEVMARLESRAHGHPEFDGFLIFGGNGGGEYLALDTHQATPWPVVTIDMVAGRNSAESVATDFDSFIELIGVEPIEG